MRNVGDSPTDVVLGAGKAYVSNLDGTVAVISTSSNTVTGRVTVGVPAKSLALTPDGGLLFVAGTNDTVVAIDTASNTVVSALITDPTPDTASSPNLAVAASGVIYQTDSSDGTLRSMTIAGYVPSASQFDRTTIVSGLTRAGRLPVPAGRTDAHRGEGRGDQGRVRQRPGPGHAVDHAADEQRGVARDRRHRDRPEFRPERLRVRLLRHAGQAATGLTPDGHQPDGERSDH